MDIIDTMDSIKDKIKRFTSDKYSYNDYLSLTSYFNNEGNTSEWKKGMEQEWNETNTAIDNPERLGQVLDRLHHKINLSSKVKPNSFQRIYHLFSKVAVVLLIPALIAITVLSYWSSHPYGKATSWAEIHSPAGSRTQFQLPDGSRGWLNSGSSIKYPVNFMQNRRVEIRGEVWLDVAHIKSEEFRVITPWFDVKVLGTQFNVIAYDDAPTCEVILETGKVVVLGKDKETKGELIPDQQLVFNKLTRTFNKTSIDSKNYTSWKDGLLKFKNVPMAEIARRLERKYNAEIVLHGDSLKTSIFRATFSDENLEEICKMLSAVAPISFKIHPREKLSDNTFAKLKVEMWLKNNINLK